jgi:hypothetical protein
MEVLFVFQISFPQMYVFQISSWAFVRVNFMRLSFWTSKLFTPLQLTSTFFNVSFDLGLGGFVSGEEFNNQRLH